MFALETTEAQWNTHPHKGEGTARMMEGERVNWCSYETAIQTSINKYVNIYIKLCNFFLRGHSLGLGGCSSCTRCPQFHVCALLWKTNPNLWGLGHWLWNFIAGEQLLLCKTQFHVSGKLLISGPAWNCSGAKYSSCWQGCPSGKTNINTNIGRIESITVLCLTQAGPAQAAEINTGWQILMRWKEKKKKDNLTNMANIH